MTDAHLLGLAAQQHRCVAGRQLHLPEKALRHRVAGGWLGAVHEGVFVVGPVGDDPRVRWMAATLTTPDSVLGFASAGAAYGFWRDGPVPIIVRPGSGGPEHWDGVLIHRSTCLDGETRRLDGIPITTPERTVLDLAPHVTPTQLARIVRDAVRLEHATVDSLLACVRRHKGRRGVAKLNRVVSGYAGIPIRRTKSDAEVIGLTVLHQAGRAPDAHNVFVEGLEADLVWFAEKVIVELDGPRYHLDAAEDLRKQRIWEAAGWTVLRLSTDDVYVAPERLVALAPAR